MAIDNKLDITSNGFPSAVNALSRRINAIKSNLSACGLDITVTSTRTHKEVKIINNNNRKPPIKIEDAV